MAKKAFARPATKLPAARTATATRGASASSASAGAGTAHAAFLQAMKGIGKNWTEARKVQDTGGSFEDPKIDDGKYVAQLISSQVNAPQIKNGPNKGSYQCVVEFRFTVAEGDFKGTSLRISHWLSETEYTTVQEALERLFKDLQRLGFETAGMEPADLPAVAKELSAAKPFVTLSCKNKTTSKGKDVVNVYLNKVVDPAEYGITVE